MSTIFVTGANGFVGSHLVPAVIDAGHHVLALVRDDAGAEEVLRRLTPVQQASVETRRGDVTTPDTLPAGDRRCRRRPPPRRPSARLGRRRKPAPRQHRGHAQRHRRGEGRGRPAVRPSRRAGSRRRAAAPLRQLQGQGHGPGARERARLDDPQAVDPVRPPGRLLQHPRRARPPVPRHRADHRQGRRPLPAAGHR